MIAKIAVSAANFAIDKPYSYAVPEGMNLQPGLRVMVPFGRSNRHTEGVVLSVEEGSEAGLKQIAAVLDETPVLSMHMLQLAQFMRSRYFCTSFDAVRTMLPTASSSRPPLWRKPMPNCSKAGARLMKAT